MTNIDIEAYLEGSLSEEEQAALEQELRRNPALARQVEAQRKATHLLRRQLLREQVTSVLSEQVVHRKSRRRFWAILGTLLLLLLAGYFLFFGEKQPATQSVQPEATAPDSIFQNETPPVAPPGTAPAEPVPAEKKPDNTPQPIAENKPADLPLPAYPSPNVRGQGGNNAAWKALLDQVWYTQLPPRAAGFKAPFAEPVQSLSKRDFEDAFVQLETLEADQPENDTLRLLKGYCLLEMGEGSDARRYFGQLERTPPAWKAWTEWHGSLALLLSGEAKKAVPEFQKIAKQQDHPYQRHAARALAVFGE